MDHQSDPASDQAPEKQPAGEAQRTSEAVQRAQKLPGVERVERAREGSAAESLLLHLEDGGTLRVPLDQLTGMGQMNDYTLLNQLKSRFGEGDA